MLLKKDDPRRIAISIRKHLTMLVRPLISTFGVLLLWYGLNRKLGVHFDRASIDPIAIAEVILVIPFGLLAATAVTKAWDKQDRIVDAIFMGGPEGERLFLRYRDERIRVGIHVILIALASAIVLLTAMIPFQMAWMGGLVMALVTFTHSLVWEGIRLLEDPARSQWISSRVPNRWMETEVDQKFFHNLLGEGEEQ